MDRGVFSLGLLHSISVHSTAIEMTEWMPSNNIMVHSCTEVIAYICNYAYGGTTDDGTAITYKR
jgi:hypothetical protein